MKRNVRFLIATTLAVLLLVGCQKPDDGTFRVLWRAGQVPGTLLSQFGKRPDVKLVVEIYTSDEDLLEKLAAKDAAYDLVEVNDRLAQELMDAGSLRPLHRGTIPNLANIDPFFLRVPFAPGEKYAAPYMAGFMGIVYNAEIVTLPIVSFNDVFHPLHKGGIATGPDPLEITASALLFAGLPLQELNNDKALAQITPLLNNWLSKVGAFPSTDPADALLRGDAYIGIVRSDDAARLFSANPKFQWVLPVEGFRLFVNALVIPKIARHTATAEAAINFLLSPESGLLISKEFPGTNPNLAARKLLSEAQLNNPASYPSDFNVAQATTFPALGDNAQKIRAYVMSLKAPVEQNSVSPR